MVDYKYKVVSKKTLTPAEYKTLKSQGTIFSKDQLIKAEIETSHGVFFMYCHKRYTAKGAKTKLDSLVKDLIQQKLGIREESNDDDY